MKPEVVTVSFEVLRNEVPNVKKRATQYERRIYWLLHAANGGVVSVGSLWDAIYGHLPESDWPTDDSSLRVLITRLRKKLIGVKIVNHHGIGYSMDVKQ